jgi:diguanylate cyclase (GGDEF)-like protein
MSETPLFVERESKGHLPYELKSPEFSGKYVMGNLELEISDMKTAGKKTDYLEEQRERFGAMFKKLGLMDETGQSTSNVKDEGLKSLLVGYIQEEMDKADIDQDVLLKEKLRGDSLYIEAKYNLIDSYKDPLTGLYNRRGLIETLSFVMRHQKQFFGEGKELGGKKIAIIMTDLDDFGQYNKKEGHQKGDQVLEDCAVAMVNGVRVGDLVGRWGGEENVAIVFGADPYLIDARMSQNLSKKIPVTFTSGAVSIDWEYMRALLNGEVTIDEHGDIVMGEARDLTYKEKEELFSKIVLSVADSGMRRAKEEGKDRLEVGSILKSRGAGN